MRKIFFAFLILIGLISCKQTSETEKLNVAHTQKAQKLDSLFSEMLKYGEFNGNVLIAENDTIILQKSYGIENRETNEALTKHSLFNLASVTKQFTATAIYLLVKDGRLSLDDNMAQYIPELDFYEGITISHLVHHTSGLPDYMQLLNEKGDKSRIATNDYVIELFAQEKPELDFEPNQNWAYSNTGYFLLASIIERVSHTSYGEFLKEKIFDPLEMNDTEVLFVYKDDLTIDHLALGYTIDSTGAYMGQSDYAKSFDGVYGQGRLYATASDLYKWDRAIKRNEILSENDVKHIFSNPTLDSGENTDYGFGWFLNDDLDYGNIASHSGSWDGYLTYIERHFDKDKTIIMLQNNGNGTGKTRIPTENTRRILYSQPVAPAFRLADEIQQKYAGIYISEKGRETEILFKDKSLWIVMSPDMKFELMPEANTKFVVNGFRPKVTYEFILDEHGDVEKYRVQQPEQGVDRTSLRKR
ncbi:serine hydrolase domain-containing protein [Pontibacter sp. G13]|uniref:serine hydrolase domain-containing protein n=1 Tax=Pontibacter sp. G13 TaxID=3074898 RepID=UPI00288963CD|nr:serine hydrolase domain-containing protein [Pontibacter sp. G13]WNJ19508.1 serine hydrolase domain-containing protein [Pontibacter sp. G13]